MDQSEANYRTERGSGGMLKSNFSNNCSCTSKIVIKVGSSFRRYRARFCKSGNSSEVLSQPRACPDHPKSRHWKL